MFVEYIKIFFDCSHHLSNTGMAQYPDSPKSTLYYNIAVWVF